MENDLIFRLEKILSESFKCISSISNSYFADTHKIEFDSGKKYFLKLSKLKNLRLLSSEAEGLDELRKLKVISVPEIVALDQDYLLLEWIERGDYNTDSGLEKLGSQLAEMHRIPGLKFGYKNDNYIGGSPQCNIPSILGSENWVSFYTENRLKFQLELADKNGYVTPEIRNLMESLMIKMPELLSGTEENPSLLHGDLWSGNYIIDISGKPWLIDPAVYYGHREADLAMTSLFGGFSDVFYSAYKSEFQISPGYADREPLYQLYHLMNHLNLFGKGFYKQILTVLKRYVG